VRPEKIIDTYLPENADFPLLRIRQKGSKYEITKKAPTGSDFSTHTELTIPLEQDEYMALQKSSQRTVEKDRYSMVDDSQTIEVDVFTGKLAGLVLIDFEFTSEEAMRGFVAPEFCLADVTQERFILGGQLAGRSYAEIATELERFGYQPLSR
jgi:CYTH domain-containing protein